MEEVEEDEEEGHVFIPVFRPYIPLAVEKAAISVVMLEKQPAAFIRSKGPAPNSAIKFFYM